MKEKMVYIISNPAWPNWYKVGIASNWKKRWKSYNTGSPFRDYKFEWGVTTEHWKVIEDSVHNSFKCNFEWVDGSIEDIKLHINKSIKYYESKESISSITAEVIGEGIPEDIRIDDTTEQRDTIHREETGHDTSPDKGPSGIRGGFSFPEREAGSRKGFRGSKGNYTNRYFE